MAANGPVPTHLTFLTSLSSHSIGTKVRFLGCVLAYNAQIGLLELAHAYPPSLSSSNVRAMVDVNIILETTKKEDFEIGAWINVVGYVQGSKRKGGEPNVKVRVQAIMIWGAGGLRSGEYEKAVEGRLEVGSEKDPKVL